MAKEQKQPEPVPVSATLEESGQPKSYRLQVTLGFVSLILLQIIALCFVLPSKEPSERPPAATGKRTEDIIEKPIGSGPFRITVPENDLITTYSLVIHVGVRKKEDSRFQRRYDECVQQIVHRVETVLRASSRDEWKDAGHTVIKSRIMKEINDVLGTAWVVEVYPTEFSIQTS